MKKSKTIYIRRGKNGHPYAAYTESGQFITNLDRLGDARKIWGIETKLGLIELKRDLQKK